MGKPPIITTTKRLPFQELGPDEFERLCLRLVTARGYVRAEHYGALGSDLGRDVIAYKQADSGEGLWYFQCKRYKEIGASELVKEIDKINEASSKGLISRPAGIVIVTSADASAATRDTVHNHCVSKGYASEFWGRPELDLYVSQQRDIVEQFFGRGLLPVPVPHQLPPVPTDFTGRESELKELLAGIGQGGATIYGLRGMGGIGKTTLALRLAHQLREEFPDGQIYLDLKGINPRPLTAAEAQAHVIRSFQPGISLPDNGDAISGLFYTMLDGKRALLLMDNARDDVQVKPLVPPAGSVLIVTSRQRFTLPGLLRLDLDSLPEADACELLLKITPRIESYALEISRLCGCLPIALRLAAGALGQRVNLSPAEYGKRLTGAQTRLELVEAALNVSYDMLEPELQRSWRSLAVFPGTFDDRGAAAILDLTLDEAKDALGRLIGYSLVEWNSATERYRLHDLARVFGDSRLSVGERWDTAKRHGIFYEKVIRQANDLYEAGGEDILAGLRLFDLEWSNIQGGHEWAREHRADDEEALGLCDSYARSGVFVLGLRAHPRERIAWSNLGLEAARKLKRRQAEALHLGDLGICYRDLAEYRRAIDFYEQSLAIAREIGDQKEEGMALGNLGNAFHRLGEHHRAIELGEQHLAIARKIGDRRGEDAALGELGQCYHALGEYRRAIDFQLQKLAIAREIGHRRAVGTALGDLGLAYHKLHDYRRALEFHEQHLTMAREIGDRRRYGQSLVNLGLAYQGLGEYHRSFEFYEQGLAVAREIGDRRGEGYALWNFSLALDEMGNRALAITKAESSLRIRVAIEDPEAEKVRRQLAEWKSSGQEATCQTDGE